MPAKPDMTRDNPAGDGSAAPRDAGRRAALRKLAAGLGLTAGASLMPERWRTPLVEMVVSPAHATFGTL